MHIIIIIVVVIFILVYSYHEGILGTITNGLFQAYRSLEYPDEIITQACMIDDVILSQIYDNVRNTDKIKPIYEKILNNEHTDCDVKKLLKYLDPESRKKIGLDTICDFSDCVG